MTVTAVFDATPARVWELWENPRQLEGWWGPPAYPATVVEHNLTPGAMVTYFMTGPEGDQHHGWWRVLTVEAPHVLEVEDGFADSDGNPMTDMPTTIARVTVTQLEDGGGTQMTITTTFPSLGALEQMVEMGMEEGVKSAIGQIEGLLSEDDTAL
jgi:uncharacterized protein YndB with AHSA1/START domain